MPLSFDCSNSRTMIQLCFEFEAWVDSINDHDLTKKPELTLDSSDEIITRFYGHRFLSGWLNVKYSGQAVRI